jgi:hypothetical protein
MLDQRIAPTRYIPDEEIFSSIRTDIFLEISSPTIPNHQAPVTSVESKSQGSSYIATICRLSAWATARERTRVRVGVRKEVAV